MKTDTQIMNELAVSSGFLKPQSSWGYYKNDSIFDYWKRISNKYL